MNDNGNILDAAGIAAIAALMNTKIPKLDEEGNIIRGEYQRSLEVDKIPIPISVVKIGNTLLLDPTWVEEEVSDAKITITLDENNIIRAMQKSGGGSFTEEEIYKALELAKKKSKEIRALVKKALKK